MHKMRMYFAHINMMIDKQYIQFDMLFFNLHSASERFAQTNLGLVLNIYLRQGWLCMSNGERFFPRAFCCLKLRHKRMYYCRGHNELSL